MPEENGKFENKMAEWKGYVARALEDVTSDIHELAEETKKLWNSDESIKETCKKELTANVDKIWNSIEKLQDELKTLLFKASAFGAICGIVVTIIGFVLKALLFP